MDMKWNEIETVLVRQLISEHFDFTSSQLNGQCMKSDESDKLEPIKLQKIIAFCRYACM